MAATKFLIITHLSTKDLTRFFSKIAISFDLQFNGTPCWIWSTNRSIEGYGLFGWKGLTVLTHRFIFAWLIHPLPRGIKHGELDHLCKRPSCCNPLHLEFVTRRINMFRSNNQGAKNSCKTSCPKGHPLSGDNLYVNPKGARECRTCHVLRWRAYADLVNPHRIRRIPTARICLTDP